MPFHFSEDFAVFEYEVALSFGSLNGLISGGLQGYWNWVQLVENGGVVVLYSLAWMGTDFFKGEYAIHWIKIAGEGAQILACLYLILTAFFGLNIILDIEVIDVGWWEEEDGLG